jgi:hypothetical protein
VEPFRVLEGSSMNEEFWPEERLFKMQPDILEEENS